MKKSNQNETCTFYHYCKCNVYMWVAFRISLILCLFSLHFIIYPVGSIFIYLCLSTFNLWAKYLTAFIIDDDDDDDSGGYRINRQQQQWLDVISIACYQFIWTTILIQPFQNPATVQKHILHTHMNRV